MKILKYSEAQFAQNTTKLRTSSCVKSLVTAPMQIMQISPILFSLLFPSIHPSFLSFFPPFIFPSFLPSNSKCYFYISTMYRRVSNLITWVDKSLTPTTNNIGSSCFIFGLLFAHISETREFEIILDWDIQLRFRGLIICLHLGVEEHGEKWYF